MASFWETSILPFLRVARYVITYLPRYFSTPLFWVVAFLIAWQYVRMARIERHLYGEARYPLFRHLAWSAFFGTLGGIIASALLVIMGVALNQAGVMYLWLTAVALMMIDPRLMCFSYAGGIISISYLLFSWPLVDIPTLMALVAVLHLVESLLIYLHGPRDPVPVAIKHSSGKVVGGFNLQKFWPVPFMALIAIYATGGVAPVMGDGTAMPEWWPLISSIDINMEQSLLFFSLFPVIAGMGYGELAISSTPRQKTRFTAKLLALYSGILLILSLAATRYLVFVWAAALFAPLAHEALVYVGNWCEQREQPLYISPAYGVKILDIRPRSIAAKAGLATGDVVIAINGHLIDSYKDFKALILQYAPLVSIMVEKPDGKRVTLELLFEPQSQSLGVIPVPDESTEIFLEARFRSPLGLIHHWIRKIKRW